MSADRLARLRAQFDAAAVDALMVIQAENRRYLSGFTGSSGTLFISGRSTILATDFRYLEQAGVQAPLYEVVRIENSEPYEVFAQVLGDLGVRRLGFEAAHLSVAQFRELEKALADRKVTLVPTEGLVEQIRMVKDTDELLKIRRAVALADDALDHVSQNVLRPGLSERQVAWEIEKRMRECGADGPAFDTIVASGPNAALPHHRPADRPIGAGEPVVVDMGALADGYRSDVTRTVWCGRPDGMLREIYSIVLEAQLLAAERTRAGMVSREADAIARDHIAAAGFGDQFGHGLGHGIGLAVHELPRLARTGDDTLADGMVFSIEPGIYLPGWGGVRIEDLVFLQDGVPSVLTRAAKFRFEMG
jgi:Xaa-Pro aminopeptidase